MIESCDIVPKKRVQNYKKTSLKVQKECFFLTKTEKNPFEIFSNGFLKCSIK